MDVLHTAWDDYRWPLRQARISAATCSTAANWESATASKCRLKLGDRAQGALHEKRYNRPLVPQG